MDFITDFDVSKSNNYVVTSSKDKTIRIWDFKKAQEVCIFQNFTEGVDLAKFADTSEFGEILIAFSTDGIIHIYEFQKFLDEQSPVRNVEWWKRERENYFKRRGFPEFGSCKPTARVTRAESKQQLESPGPHEEEDPFILAIKQANKIPYIRLSHQYQTSNKNLIFTVVTCNKNGVICAGAKNGDFITWKLDKRSFVLDKCRHISTEKLQKKSIHLVEWSPDQKYIFAGSIDGSATIWQISPDSVVAFKPEKYFMIDDRQKKSGVQCDTVAWSCKGTWAFCAISGSTKSEDGRHQRRNEEQVTPRSTIYVIDIKNKHIAHKLAERDGIILQYYTFALMAHPRFEQILVSGSASGKIIIWDIVNAVPLHKFIETGIYSYEPRLMNDIFDGRFSPDGNTFAVGTNLGALSIYSNKSNQSYQLTHTEQFFLSQGLTPDFLQQNPNSRVIVCNHQLARYQPQPLLTMVGGYQRSIEDKILIEIKLEKFQEILDEKLKELVIERKVHALLDDSEYIDEDQNLPQINGKEQLSLADVIESLDPRMIEDFFKQRQQDRQQIVNSPEYMKKIQQYTLSKHDDILKQFRKARIIAEKQASYTIMKEQVASEQKYYEDLQSALLIELGIDRNAFNRVLEEHNFEETFNQQDIDDTVPNHRNNNTPTRRNYQNRQNQQRRYTPMRTRNPQPRHNQGWRGHLRSMDIQDSALNNNNNNRAVDDLSSRNRSSRFTEQVNQREQRALRRSGGALNEYRGRRNQERRPNLRSATNTNRAQSLSRRNNLVIGDSQSEDDERGEQQIQLRSRSHTQTRNNFNEYDHSSFRYPDNLNLSSDQEPSGRRGGRGRGRPRYNSSLYDSNQSSDQNDFDDDDDDELDQNYQLLKKSKRKSRKRNKYYNSNSSYKYANGRRIQRRQYYSSSNDGQYLSINKNPPRNRKSHFELEQFNLKKREKQKQQAKIQPYILFYTDRNKSSQLVCNFCQRTIPDRSNIIGPFRKTKKNIEITQSNFKLQDLPEVALIHQDCLRINDFTFQYALNSKRSNPDYMWVGIADYFLFKRAKEQELKQQDQQGNVDFQCYRCFSFYPTIKCFTCDKKFHGHLCAKLYGKCLKIEQQLRFKCFDCIYIQMQLEDHDTEKALNYLGEIDRERFKQFAPKKLKYNVDALKQTKREKELPKFFEKFGELQSEQEFYKTFIYTTTSRCRSNGVIYDDDDEYDYSVKSQSQELQDSQEEDKEEDKVYEHVTTNKQQLQQQNIQYNFDEDYLPQVGDQIYFIPQRYQESLASNWALIKSLQEMKDMDIVMKIKDMIPNFDVFQAEYGGILVEIIDIEYLHPPINQIKMYLNNKNENVPNIVLFIRLRIIGIASGFEQSQQQQEEQQLLEIYITKDNINCFVEKHVYEASTKQFGIFNIKQFEGLKVETKKLGKVTIQSAFAFQMEFLPYSLYKAFEVTPQHSNEEVLVSGWDLLHKDDDNADDEEDKEVDNQVQNSISKIPFTLRVKIMKQMYSFLKQNKKNYHWFFSEVNKAEYSQYLHFVAVEYNMKLIMKRLMFDYYRSVKAFKFDIDYISKNAEKYNSTSSEIYEFALEMRNQLIDVIDSQVNNFQNGMAYEDQIFDMKKEQSQYQQQYQFIKMEQSEKQEEKSQSQQEDIENQHTNHEKRSTRITIDKNTGQISTLTPNENSFKSRCNDDNSQPKIYKRQVRELKNNIISIPLRQNEDQVCEERQQMNKRLTSNGIDQNYQLQDIIMDFQKHQEKKSVVIQLLEVDNNLKSRLRGKKGRGSIGLPGTTLENERLPRNRVLKRRI